jgi:hypothetical protein
MSRIWYDTFFLVVNFIDDTWWPHHVTIRLFDALNTTRATLVEIMKPLLSQYQSTKKIVAYMKNERSNLNTLELAFLQLVNYEPWQLTSPYVGACFGHAMSKTCQYATLDDKICVGMTQASLKNAKSTLLKIVT